MISSAVADCYLPLQIYLTRQTDPTIFLSFQQIEIILGDALPEAAYKYHCWWVNSRINGSHAAGWVTAGFEVCDVRIGDYVEFRKI
ncbi:DUF7662 domain-containing protein [Bacillus marasmi]|uniref:DUF7662 domain-containing protein n=1 Tax=Bacillus marasmi TaxID=1926279 RepID=UPI0011CA31E0|nr:hypothetical protein [Bacillus marasmi]